jgi:hypothetical protein
MAFEPGDRVRLRWRPSQEMAVKLISGDYVLCEAWAGSGINVGAWSAEALEPAPVAPTIRRLPDAQRERS